MSSKLAKLAEHRKLEFREGIRFESGHGTLPSTCTNCGSKLDFVRKTSTTMKGITSVTVLKCRQNGHEIELD